MKNTKFSHKVIAVFLTVNFLTTIVPVNNIYASNNGPGSPEAAGFEPVDATDMVNLATGDLSYVLPLMSVEGFPINLSYHAGMTMDMDASWAGLGWYLNPGAINRSVTNTPDDWKSGVGINFNSFHDVTDYYGVKVGIGLSKAASVGVGLNWGGGKGLSGSVNANYGPFSAYADTNGNTDASVGLNILQLSYGPVSANTKLSYSLENQWELTGSVKYVDEENQSSVGMSYSSSGAFSIGAQGKNSKGKDVGGSIGMDASSFSSGDANVDQQSSGITIPFKVLGIPISLGLTKTKVKVNIKKGFYNQEWGALYSSDYSDFSSGTPRINSVNPNTGFNDYAVRTNSMDMYSTRLPQSEKEFIGDYSKDIENINFSFMGYDRYNVAAQGLMGNMTPRVFQNSTIFDKGQRTKNAYSNDIHVFWHHGKSMNAVSRVIGHPDPNADYGTSDLYFNFDGQFTNNEINDVNGVGSSNLNNAFDINDLIDEGAHQGSSTQMSNYGRAKSPNYVQVFTNREIANNTAQAQGLITPSNTNDADRDDPAFYAPDGIGAYMITAPDGKTYHFSLPVYHYEQIQRGQINTQENVIFNIANVNERRQFTRYATHWLLTAVTGSDYVDRPDPNSGNSLHSFNKEDYGYWVELEYGKWSDGFVWRSPYKDHVYNYSTNIKSRIEDKDKGSYSFGRKQMYYLDKINTKNKTALFIKDIRYDGIGKNLKFQYSNATTYLLPFGQSLSTPGGKYLGHTGDGENGESLKYTDGGIYVREFEQRPGTTGIANRGVQYNREYTLKLSKIVLVDSEIGKTLSKNTGGSLGTLYTGYTPNDTCAPNWESDYFEAEYGPDYSYVTHNEQDVLDVNDVDNTFIEQHALKVVELNHSYDLAKNSPSSSDAPISKNPQKGRLTLESVQIKGKGGTEYMPATSFNYYLKDLDNLNFTPLNDTDKEDIEDYLLQKKAMVDEWGFLQGEEVENGIVHNKIKAWSLKDITMPTGAKIEIDYEEDDYWTEAFSRRYWTEGLRFNLYPVNDQYFNITITKDQNSTSAGFKFSDYFSLDEKVFFDFWLCTVDEDYNLGCNVQRNKVNVIGETPTQPHSVSDTQVTFKLNKNQYIETLENSEDIFSPTFTLYSGFGDPLNGPRNSCPNPEGCHDGFNLTYKLLANRVPEDETGGGLRVKELRTVDLDSDMTYKATYDYNHPTKNRSSGITSYAPVDGLKYVPYQSEVPPPGVVYEYVTMKETSNSGDYYSKTRYRHHVLKPVYNIFNPNIEMEALDANSPDEDKIFWANVTDNYGGFNGTNSKKIKAKKIDININTALIGQIKSIENLNSQGHVMAKTDNEYINGLNLVLREPNKGYTKETFNSMKTVFQTNTDGTVIENSKRLLSVSSKTEYNNMLKKTTSTVGGHKSTVEYSDVDPWLGSYRRSKTTLADGSYRMDNRIPAYEKYLGMQSKVLNPSNKNMLTQQAMEISSWSKVGNTTGWKTLNANITTWNDTWPYRDVQGNESIESGIWRKQKSFIWKDDVDPDDGTYITSVDTYNTHFDWVSGEPTSDNWKNDSEITRYNHWSAPIEARDINDNYASSKMADNNSKTVVSGNASYTELFASGAEYDIDGTYLDQEIKGAQFRTSEFAHTGKYALKISSGHKGFEIDMQAGEHADDNYKISVWVLKSQDKLQINIDGIPKEFNGEKVQAGDWTMLNHYVGLDETAHNIYLTTDSTSDIYIDDFRIHPVYSSLNTYVYDENTDELNYILDSNNMATKYVYDNAGRLCQTFQEVEADYPATDGGFKLVNKYKYHYKGISNSNECECCEDDDQGNDNEDYTELTIKELQEVDKGVFIRVFDALVGGGSGDYTYQWRWLTDYETNTYSDYVIQNGKQEVPFAVKMCDIKESTFNKIWLVELKIIDNVTGKTTTKKEIVELSDCKSVLNASKWADIEISSNYEPCYSGTKYSFRPYVIKPEHSNYSYLYQTYNHITEQWTGYNAISSAKNNFCGDIYYAPSGECKTEYSIYQTIQYRIIDNETGDIFQSNIMDVYLDCVDDPGNGVVIANSNDHSKYNVFGNVVERSTTGEIIDVYKFTDKINNKN